MFALDESASARNEEAYVKDVIATGDFSISDCVRYPAVCTHYVKMLIRNGNETNGYPVLREGEEVPEPSRVYELLQSRRCVRSSKSPHPDLRFLRKASVAAATLACQNLDKAPIACRAVEMPNKAPWDNFADCLYHFWIHYCYGEGLDRTHDLAREVMLFVFYGKFRWTYVKKKVHFTRVKPVLFWLHKKVSHGRSRFAKNVKHCFKKFIALYDNNESWSTYLNDKGENTPDTKYLAAVEEGLRAYAQVDNYSMGTGVLRSADRWAKVEMWRKREAYIALARHLLVGKSYKQWDCFSFSDFMFRQRCGRVFKKRHLPLSDGEDKKHFGNDIDFIWTQDLPSPTPIKRKVQSTTATQPVNKRKAKRKARPLMFDVELGCLVPWEQT